MLIVAVALGFAGVFHGSVAPIVIAVTIAGLGIGLGCPPGVELIMGSVPPEHAGQAAGVNETIVEAGGAFGIAVMGSVLAAAAGGAGSIAPDNLVGPGGASAQARFTDALGPTMFTASGLLVVGAMLVIWRTRGVADPPPDEIDAVAVSSAGLVTPEPHTL